eukprot:TRINITY_DN4594_c0_g2_i1.p1 TRINITY_DN4594_c0_g2~~TRINITY_DN4594_c0_g2_i1.p1  ORF type:complete len:201 (+),score=51.69 TRINITY_DN4594_c0_g2_i1:51-605(+)
MASIARLVVAALGLSATLEMVAGQPAQLPELRVIRSHQFSTTYSCNGNYQDSALFLIPVEQAHNAPDLLYNGACGERSYFQAATAGTDLGFIADLGPVALTEVNAQRIAHSGGFAFAQNTQLNHTYAVVGVRDDLRSWFAFKVTDFTPGSLPATVQYTTFLYEQHRVTNESPNFDWNKYPQPAH